MDPLRRLGASGTREGFFDGNPAPGPFGIPVWAYEHTRGGQPGGGDEWFANGRTRLVWDPSWLGGGTPLWAQADDTHADIRQDFSQHNVSVDSDTSFRSIGVISWTNPFDTYRIDVVGELVLSWAGSGNPVGSGAVDVVIAHERAADGLVDAIFSQTVTKPTPTDPAREELALAVDLRGLELAKGDRLLVSHRGREVSPGRWMLLADRIAIVPASSENTAVVTLDVQSNAAPITAAMSSSHGLEFAGDRGRVDLGNPPELQITGDQTIEMWLKPANFSERRNPWNKAYAGEGTITQELAGGLTYFWGNLGIDGGTSPENYQGFNSGRSLILDQWTHVAVVRDLTNGSLQWYYNGELTREGVPNFPAAVAGTQAARIGDGYTFGYAGCIDEVRVWNVARTQAEIQASLNQRLNGDEPGLSGYWPFEEGVGTQTNDQSTAEIHGMLTGGASGPNWVDAALPFEAALATTEEIDLTIVLDGSDTDGDPLTATVTRLPEWGQLFQTDDGVTRGALIDLVPAGVTDSQRRIIYVPDPDYDRFDSVSYTLNDGKVDSAEGTYQVAIMPINDPPLANEDNYNTVEDVPISTGNVLANDGDIEGDSIAVDSFTQPASGGTVTYSGNGIFDYTPGTGFSGSDFFEYSLTDGIATGSAARVNVFVTSVDEYVWNNPAGGNWHTASNWTPNAVPGSGDRAVIALDGDYTVMVDQHTTISVLVVGGNSGTQKLRNPNRTLTIINQGSLGPTSLYEQAGGELTGTAPVVFDGGFV